MQTKSLKRVRGADYKNEREKIVVNHRLLEVTLERRASVPHSRLSRVDRRSSAISQSEFESSSSGSVAIGDPRITSLSDVGIHLLNDGSSSSVDGC